MALGVYHHWSSKRARKRAALAPPPPPGDASVPPDTEIDAQPSRMSAGSITVIAILFMFVIAIIVAILVKVLTTKNSAGMWGVGIGAVAIVVAVVLASMAFSSATKTRKTAPDNNDPHPVPPPTPAKKKLSWGWILAIICLWVLGASVIPPWWEKNVVHGGRGAIAPSDQWVFEWEAPPETYIRGKSKSGPIEATIDKYDNQSFWIILTYVEYGKTEKTIIHLGKVTSGFWEGFWEQNNPKDSGRCNLHEMGTNVWSGTMTGTAGIPAFCKLRKVHTSKPKK